MIGQYKRARNFFTRDLWLREPEPGVRGWPLYIARTSVLVIEGSWNQELMVRAAALTYKVAFSIIPLLAVMLALFKGFGGLDSYAGKMQTFILENLAQGMGEKVITTLKNLIDRMDAAALGVAGFAILLFTSISLLTTIEQSFNVIWGVRRPRTWIRRVTVYWTLMTIGPLFIAISLAATGFVQNQGTYQWLVDKVPLFNSLILFIVPFMLTWFVFGAIYMIMPNTKVPFRAALIGALVAGTAWELLKRLWILYNAKVIASYEVYGSLGAIPVFLLWIYLSWILVLFGAEIAFAAQHVRTYKREIEVPKLSPAFKERLAIHVMVEVARDFTSGREPANGEQLAERLKVPVRACQEVLFNLTTANLLREIAAGQTATYVPSEDLGRISVKRVVESLRKHGDDPVVASDGYGDRLSKLLTEAEASSSRLLESTTLRDLVDGTSLPPSGPA